MVDENITDGARAAFAQWFEPKYSSGRRSDEVVWIEEKWARSKITRAVQGYDAKGAKVRYPVRLDVECLHWLNLFDGKKNRVLFQV